MHIGKKYTYKYIRGETIFLPKYYEGSGTYIKDSTDGNYYIFASEIIDKQCFWVVYVEKSDVLDEIDTDRDVIDNIGVNSIQFYLENNTKLQLFRITPHSIQFNITYYDINHFIEDYFAVGTGKGYLEAMKHWYSCLLDNE
jgi:hypothetical protein